MFFFLECIVPLPAIFKYAYFAGYFCKKKKDPVCFRDGDLYSFSSSENSFLQSGWSFFTLKFDLNSQVTSIKYMMLKKG